jgi:hypothetical protein
VTTTRLTAVERKVFNAPTDTRHALLARTEPAMGTLDERLGIIIKRHGGSIGMVRASDSERLDHARWLARNGLAS